jgi:dolichol-phosphate mannosyltransferase
MKKISFVFPCFNEEKVLDKLAEEMSKIMPQLSDYELEIICVNDGSSDSTLLKLKEIQSKDQKYKIISFSRNFGQQMAITAGLDFASGDAVIIMDADLQDPPQIAIELIKKWEEGFDVVYAQRKKREGESFFKRLTSFAFYRVLDSLAQIKIPKDTGDFRLMDRKVVDSVKQFREKNRYLRGIVSYVGFKQTAVLFDRPERFAGETKWPLHKMLGLAMDAIIGYSTIPLKFVTNMGLLVVFFSIIGIIYAIFMRFFMPEITVSGWTFLVISILFLGGVQMIMIGILGNYIGRIYSEVQQRPLYIVDEIIGFN